MRKMSMRYAILSCEPINKVCPQLSVNYDLIMSGQGQCPPHSPMPCPLSRPILLYSQLPKTINCITASSAGQWGHPRSWGPGPGVSITWLPASEREGER